MDDRQGIGTHGRVPSPPPAHTNQARAKDADHRSK
jgi:hypothetical protein